MTSRMPVAAGRTRAHDLTGGYLKSVHHVGVPVRSLESWLAWWSDLVEIDSEHVEVSEVGPMHLCLEVDDIEHVSRALAEHEVLRGRPMRVAGGLDGEACCYFRGPDGVEFELRQRRR